MLWNECFPYKLLEFQEKKHTTLPPPSSWKEHLKACTTERGLSSLGDTVRAKKVRLP